MNLSKRFDLHPQIISNWKRKFITREAGIALKVPELYWKIDTYTFNPKSKNALDELHQYPESFEFQ